MVSLRNCIWEWGRFMNSYRSFQSTSLQLHHHKHKYFVVLKDLEPYRSAQIRIDYKVTIGNEYLMTHAFYNYMSTATTATMAHAITEPDLSKRNNTDCYRYFALCNSCFWCASYLRHMGTLRCPSCNTEIIESIPIRAEERFHFQYDRKRGVSLQFLTA